MSDEDMIWHVAAAMWKAEAIDVGAPLSVAELRTREAFLEQSIYIRTRWEKFARTAIAALPAAAPVEAHRITMKQDQSGAFIAHDVGADIMTQGPTKLEAWERLAATIAVETYNAPWDAAPVEDIGILRARVEDQANEIARLTRIIQMQPAASAEDVRAGAQMAIALFLRDRDDAFVMTPDQTDEERMESAAAILALIPEPKP